MGRKRKAVGWRLRLGGAVLLALLLGGAYLWWDTLNWRPSEATYPEQGVRVAQGSAPVNFRTLRAIGARFAYLDASDGERGRNERFGADLSAARQAGLQVGAVHRFDPCRMADGQSANFVTMVPREEDMLPPAIELARRATDCPERVSEAAVESELMTFINQLEAHAGKPVILKIGEEFEETYGLAARIERNLWLSRTRLEPEYAGRPWLLWSANLNMRSEASEEPLEWVVIQP